MSYFFDHPSLVPIISLIVGVLLLIFPKMLNYGIAIYLIIVGILGLINHH